jgi:hypothetical protein
MPHRLTPPQQPKPLTLPPPCKARRGAGGVELLAARAFLFLSLSCAPRPQLCSATPECRQGLDCVAGACEPSPSPLAGSRRLVLPPADIAVLQRGEPSAAGALPTLLTLGRTSDGPAELLLRFDLHLDRSATILRASVMLDRTDAVLPDPAPVALHANRVIGRWNERSVSWATAPPVQDVRSPRTIVWSPGPRQIRVDVTDLARRWLAHDVADQGVAIVAENTSPTGVTFALGPTSLPSAEPHAVGVTDEAPPRLEVYVR